MATPSLHKSGAILGDYKIIEFVGRDNRAALYLAEKTDPEFRFWLMEFVEPLPSRTVGEGQELFDWKGKSIFTMPVAGTTAAALPRFVRQLAWQFLTPRFAKVTEEMAVRHDKGQTYQSRGNMSLENFFFSDEGQLSLYPVSRQSSSAILPPEGNSELTPASDVYAVGYAMQSLLTPPSDEKPLLKPNRTLDAVLARATRREPAERYPTAAGLAMALNSIVPSSRADAAAEENNMPLMSGCVIPLILLVVLGVAGYAIYNAVTGGTPVAADATPTIRTSGLVIATVPPDTSIVTLEDFSLREDGNGALEAAFRLIRDNAPLSAAEANFTVFHNDRRIETVQTQPLDGERVALRFDAPLESENFFRVVATAGTQRAFATSYLFQSGVTGQDFDTGNIFENRLPPAPPIVDYLEAPTLEAGDPFEFPDWALFRLDPKAHDTELDYIGDVTVQVDSSDRHRLVSYLSFGNTAGFPARLGGSMNIKLYQDGVEVPDFDIGIVNPDEDPLTVALMIDVNGSMEGNAIAQARTAAEQFVSRLRPTDTACLYTFATALTLVQPCTTDHAATITAIQNLQTVDDTALYDALIRVAADQHLLSGRQAIVVLSDGADTVSSATLDAALSAVRDANSSFYLIGLLSEQFDGTVLERLAAESGGVYLRTPSPEQLGDLYLLTELQLENQYRLSFDSLFPDTPGGELLFRFEDDSHLRETAKLFRVVIP